MSDTPPLETVAVTETASTGSSMRDLQRKALSDLSQLATDCAATESRIEQKLRDSLAEADKSFDRNKWDIEHQSKTIREQNESKQAEKLAGIEEQYKSESKKLAQSTEAARRRIDHDHTNVERDCKEKFQQGTWLAESVFDGIVAQLSLESKKAKELVEMQLSELDALNARATDAILGFGQVPTQLAPPPMVNQPTGEQQTYEQARTEAQARVDQLSWLSLPRFFMGILPFFIVLAGVGGTGTLAWLTAGPEHRNWVVSIACGAVFAAMLIAGIMLKRRSKQQISFAYARFEQSLTEARSATQSEYRKTTQAIEQRRQESELTRKSEVQKVKEELQPLLLQSQKRRDAALVATESEQAKLSAKLEQQIEQARADAEISYRKQVREFEHRVEREEKASIERFEMKKADAHFEYEHDWKALRLRLDEGLKRTQRPFETGEVAGVASTPEWTDSAWRDWIPPRDFPPAIRFGALSVDLMAMARATNVGEMKLELPPQFEMPAALAFPNQGSMMIHCDRAGREAGLRTMQLVMTRLLTGLPPGRARFTIIDPVGLGQNFAGFMRLADFDENLVGARIWTETEHIDQRLVNLTEHMETVIQKYLRNEFATIDDYNAQAGELAEPYRFLVIADFPTSFQAESMRRLASVVGSGARCGVYALILRDTRISPPHGSALEDIQAHCLNLVHDGSKFVWKDDVFQKFPLKLDAPPSDEFLLGLLDRIGTAAKAANRVEVSFDTIAPKPEEFWSLSCSDELKVPIGRMGATRLQMLRLGKGVAQHTLIAGKTGSGKSTLLNAMVTNLSMWYSPDEVEFFLVDFKKGVEFKAYAVNALPHARAIAVESDREFGLSVLHRIDGELTRRGDMFRKAGVQDLSAYRKSDGAIVMPRTLLIIDEFQEFFSEDDKLAQDSAVLLDRLVRQGRAFGIHVLLGSQTIGGTSGLARSTIGQMAVRIALQCSEADSQMILGDNNSAARLLNRPGEAIYNDAGGLVEGNSPFQIAWLPDEKREAYLAEVRRRADITHKDRGEPVVFEGNAPADILKNRRLMKLLGEPERSNPPVPVAWLGEPVAIKDPTGINFRRQSGANVLIVGQQDEGALALMAAGMIGLAAQLSPKHAHFVVLDGTAVDSSLAGVLEKVAQSLPNPTQMVEYRAVPEAIAELHAELKRREESGESQPPAIFVFIYGLQRYRALRKSEESFSFGSGDEEEKPQPDKQFVELLREGPNHGIHVITWADTPASIDRTFDRTIMREFDHRVLFQMSASDSSSLVDSPIANKLGLHRALYYSEELGVNEKFRPYALASKTWLERVKGCLGLRESD